MSPRRAILKEPDSTRGRTRPSLIRGFTTAADKYQKAVNQLLQDRLLEGRKREPPTSKVCDVLSQTA